MMQAVQGPRYHVVYDKEEQDSYLLLGNLHRVPEHRPEHSGVAGRCSQGPSVAVVLFRPLRQQLFYAETRNEHFLVCRDMLGYEVTFLPKAEVELSLRQPWNVN